MRMAVSVVFLLCSLFFGLAFLINWIRHFRQTLPFWRLGLLASVLCAILNGFLIVLIHLQATGAAVVNTIVSGVLLPVNAFKLYLTLTLGCYYARQLGHPVFPLLRRLQDEECHAVYPDAPAVESSSAATDSGELSLSLCEVNSNSAGAGRLGEPRWSATIAPRQSTVMDRVEYASTIAVVATVSVLFSYVLFWLTEPERGSLLRGLPSECSVLLGGTVLLVAAFAEEIVFRLGVQSLLARIFRLKGSQYWLAIVLASAFWSCAHVASLDPCWVKLVQVFPIGLGLGWLHWKYGTESAILAHASFNVVGVVVLNPLISLG